MRTVLLEMEETSRPRKVTSPHVLYPVATISQSVMADKMCTMFSSSQQLF